MPTFKFRETKMDKSFEKADSVNSGRDMVFVLPPY